MRFFAPLRMTPSTAPPLQGWRNGFSLLEMVIAIFIIAVVLAFSLIAMGKGMGMSAKSNDVTIATSIAEQEMARVKNIPFPPTTYDGQSHFTDKSSFTPYNNDFAVQVSNTSYAWDLSDSSGSNDNTMLRKITVQVRRTRDLAVLAAFTTYITRNGTI